MDGYHTLSMRLSQGLVSIMEAPGDTIDLPDSTKSNEAHVVPNADKLEAVTLLSILAPQPVRDKAREHVAALAHK